mmetsp:Transcript_20122/g.33226  ORF Transcript_20122/g.33226 Transcript_20122/m.33226 type:complete len:287 (-) Transcript_20122:2045-2905(-)
MQEAKASQERCFSCGVAAGAMQAGIFNPWDRALFLSHINHRPFLSRENFVRPYEGFHQSVFHRVVTGGMYFPVEDLVRTKLPKKHGEIAHNFFVGTIAGSVIAILTNPLAAIKYQSWGSEHKGMMVRTALHMLEHGGLRVFLRAIDTTILRDMLWGGAFAMLRHEFPRHFFNEDTEIDLNQPGVVSFVSNMVAAGFATVLSAPLNYARNLQYGKNVKRKTTSKWKIFTKLWHDSRQHAIDTKTSRTGFVARRLAIGFGTLRVALGLGFSSQVYGYCVNFNLSALSG